MQNPETAKEVLVAGLHNGHLLENQAPSIIEPQLSRLENYPEVSQSAERHLRETEDRIVRIAYVLKCRVVSASGLEATVLSVAGSMGALTHTLVREAILNNSLVILPSSSSKTRPTHPSPRLYASAERLRSVEQNPVA